MNRISLLFKFLFLLIFVHACSDDNLPAGLIELRYDAANFTAPSLPQGLYESAVMFPENFTGNDSGNKLAAVEYFIDETPETAALNIYIGGELEPDSLIYTSGILSEINAGQFNTHDLNSTIELSGSDNIWVTIQYNQGNFKRTIGCDEGPAKTNGDWLFDAADGIFLPLSERSSTDINWNIRLIVDTN